jgi:hypothetical protein
VKRFDKLSNAEKPSVYATNEVDPDETLRQKERAEKNHKNWMILLNSVPWLIGIFIVFLIFLFLIILPVSEMSFGNKNFGELFQDWSKAFIKTSGTLGIALATIAIPSILKIFYNLIKCNSHTNE